MSSTDKLYIVHNDDIGGCTISSFKIDNKIYFSAGCDGKNDVVEISYFETIEDNITTNTVNLVKTKDEFVLYTLHNFFTLNEKIAVKKAIEYYKNNKYGSTKKLETTIKEQFGKYITIYPECFI